MFGYPGKVTRAMQADKKMLKGRPKKRKRVFNGWISLKRDESSFSASAKKLKTTSEISTSQLEKDLYEWVKQKKTAGLVITDAALQEKALLINESIGGDPKFEADCNWLSEFKLRYELRSCNTKPEGDSRDSRWKLMSKDEILPSIQSIANEAENFTIEENTIEVKEEPVSSNSITVGDKASAALYHFQEYRNWLVQQKECNPEHLIQLQQFHELNMDIAFRSNFVNIS